MPIFKYKVIDESGEEKEGLIETSSDSTAAEILQEKGFSVVSISLNSVKKELKILEILNRIKQKDLVIFSRQFAVMVSANVNLVQALRILVDQMENINFKIVISEVADEVDSGSRLSDALAKRPKIFSSFYINVVKSGETSGKLDEVLNYLADEMEKDYDMMSKIKGAMIYPAFVLLGLSIVGVIMMIYVVPKLTSILTETGAELPITTKILIGTSDFMTNYWWLLIVIILGLVFGFRSYLGTSFGRRQFDYIILKLPVAGKLLQRIYLVRLTRSMNTLLIGGVTITQSLKIVSEVVGNETYRHLIKETSKAVDDGKSISSVFVNSNEIPKMVSQMLSIGEKTGKLDVILERVSEFYSREIKNIIANLMTLMEPIIMVIMGLAVGVMVAAIILPMYSMASQF